MENVDIFNEAFAHIGIKTKYEAHKYGYWHQTGHCWIIRKVKDKILIIFQKRASTKKDSPNLLDISAAGHLIAGEQKEGIVREIREELGLCVDPKQLIYLGVRKAHYRFMDLINNEFSHVFFLEDETPIEEYKISKTELAGLFEIEANDLLNLFRNKIETVYGTGISFSLNSIQTLNEKFTKRQFLLREDKYHEAIVLLALSYFQHGLCITQSEDGHTSFYETCKNSI